MPITLLTGFLGSGKTTLVNLAIRHPDHAATLVVVNEFGEVGIDGSLIVSSNDNIVVLENGCMCCTVRGGMVDTLNELFTQRNAGQIKAFEHLLIETSGLADPVPILQSLLSEPTLEGRYRIARVIATFDAVNGPATLHNHDESVRQLAVADDIIVTKGDLLPPAMVAGVPPGHLSLLRRLNPAACIRSAAAVAPELHRLLLEQMPDPSVDPRQVLGWLNTPAYGVANGIHGASRGHVHDSHLEEVASLCYISEEPLPREALHLLLRALEDNLGPNLLRVKGLVNIAEEPGRPVVIHGAQHLLHNVLQLDAWPDADQRTRIVFIAQGIGRDNVEEIISLLARVATRTANARRRATGVA